MLDHIGLAVSDLERSKTFYSAALALLDIDIIVEVTPEQTGDHGAVGFGARGKPFFWIGAGSKAVNGLHVAFAANDRAAVDAFYRAAIAAGGTDNGAPGLRPHYYPNYYAAFVFDPDGNNIEAVCHTAE